jgi:hypothetical protein
VSIAGNRSSRYVLDITKVRLEYETFVALDDSTFARNRKMQTALSFAKVFKMRGSSFQTLVTLIKVPPAYEHCVGSTALSDTGPPKNDTRYKDCCAFMLELTKTPGPCEATIRHVNPVPTLIWLVSVKKISVAVDDPFTICIEGVVIKSNSALKSVSQPGSLHCS